MEQLNIFDYLYDEYKITKPVRLIELFAGVGSQALKLKDKIKIEVEGQPAKMITKLLDEVLDKIELEGGMNKERRRIEKFKEGDKVRWIGNPFIKDNIIGKVDSSWEYLDGEIGVYIQFEFMPYFLEINSKYLEKVEEE